MAKLRWALFVVLLLVALVTYFTRSSLTTVDTIRPECLLEPVQTSPAHTNLITFTRDGFRFECTPLFDYQITGLVVRKLDYSWFSIDRSDKAFPVDLCMVWGENLSKQFYRDSTVKFSQDCRFCFAQWSLKVPFRMDQLSNNHFLVSDPALEKKLKTVLAGDQVRLKGQLVDAIGKLIDQGERFDSESVDWKSSTVRTDTGPGACEVIYLEDVEVLQAGNQGSRLLFTGSLLGLGLLSVWWVVYLFRP